MSDKNDIDQKQFSRESNQTKTITKKNEIIGIILGCVNRIATISKSEQIDIAKRKKLNFNRKLQAERDYSEIKKKLLQLHSQTHTQSTLTFCTLRIVIGNIIRLIITISLTCFPYVWIEMERKKRIFDICVMEKICINHCLSPQLRQYKQWTIWIHSH